MAECRESPEYSSPPKRLKLDLTSDGEPKNTAFCSPNFGLRFEGSKFVAAPINFELGYAEESD